MNPAYFELNSSSLKERHIEIATKYPNICKISDDGILEFYCDNQILSSIRSCQGYFRESFINNLQRKAVNNVVDGQDNLDIGVWFHTVMETLDKALFNNNALTTTEALFLAKDLWIKLDIEKYRTTKGYENIGGMIGAMELVKDYMDFFNPAQASLKIIATELFFGYNKEVLITDQADSLASYNYRGYLVGTPDGVIESPLGIGPKDYKTTSRIDMVREVYKPSEQIIGYVFAINKIFGFQLAHLGKKCNTAYLIAVSKKPTKDPKNRIVKIPYTYTDGDLEAYRKRQTATFDMIYEQLVLNAESTWDTSKCCNWWYRQCPFHSLHAGATEQREQLIQSMYEVKEPWNPALRGRKNTDE